MKVTLLSKTENPLQVIYLAAKRCQCRDEDFVINSNPANFVKKVLSSNHTSILEHASFTFSIEGVSRNMTHQLVRHRLASFAQQSNRVVSPDASKVIIPATIKAFAYANAAYCKAIDEAFKAYEYMVHIGIPKEDARYVLPTGSPTSVVVTMNCRELYDNFFPLRCCSRAQAEIRDVANAMLKICKDELPAVFDNAGASCIRYGKCPEGAKSCKSKEVVNAGDHNNNG